MSTDKNINPLNQLVEQFAASRGLTELYILGEIQYYWEDLLGKAFAKQVQAIRLKEKMLYLTTQSASHRMELEIRKNEIKDLINAKIGKGIVVSEVVIR